MIIAAVETVAVNDIVLYIVDRVTLCLVEVPTSVVTMQLVHIKTVGDHGFQMTGVNTTRYDY